MLNFGKINRKSPRVTLIPIINVIFLLLIYFLIQGSNSKAAPSSIELPASISGHTISADPIEITLTESSITLEKEDINELQLQHNLAEMIHNDQGKQIILKADSKLDSTRLIHILKVIKDSGATNIYLVTDSSTLNEKERTEDAAF